MVAGNTLQNLKTSKTRRKRHVDSQLAQGCRDREPLAVLGCNTARKEKRNCCRAPVTAVLSSTGARNPQQKGCRALSSPEIRRWRRQMAVAAKRWLLTGSYEVLVVRTSNRNREGRRRSPVFTNNSRNENGGGSEELRSSFSFPGDASNNNSSGVVAWW